MFVGWIGKNERRCDQCREIYDYRDVFTVEEDGSKKLLCEHCILQAVDEYKDDDEY